MVDEAYDAEALCRLDKFTGGDLRSIIEDDPAECLVKGGWRETRFDGHAMSNPGRPGLAWSRGPAEGSMAALTVG